MTSDPPTFTIDASEFEAALKQLAVIGARDPARVHEFDLRIAMQDDLLFVRARRTGLTIEPSSFLRGFLAAFPAPADDAPESE